MSQNTDQTQIRLRVRRRAEIATDALLLELESVSGEALPGWEPGAHLDMRLPSGLARQYSLCGARDDRSVYVVVVLRERHGRGGSERSTGNSELERNSVLPSLATTSGSWTRPSMC